MSDVSRVSDKRQLGAAEVANAITIPCSLARSEDSIDIYHRN